MASPAAALEPFGGHYVLDNTVRLIVVWVGITLALVCVKFAWTYFREHDVARMWGTIGFALIVLAPSLHTLYLVGQPMYWPANMVYLLGLICSIIALYHRVMISPPWLRFIHARRERRRARQAAKRSQQ